MAAHKYIDRICLAGALLALLLTLLFMNGAALGIQPASQAMGYEARLFDTSKVHTIEIVMDGWDEFIDACENEEYVPCSVVIDNEAYKNVGLRAKGNTSLSTVSQMGSDRYSFKLEFDQYDSGKSYYGLDKLCLNNIIQDNTYMKDYLAYRLMAEFGAASPLCSYVWITVNGEDWGLYLAVEGVEDGFLQRNYGRDHGELYKPDSMSFGGGRGNGRDFDMDGFMNRGGAEQEDGQSGGTQPPEQPGGMPQGFDPSSFGGDAGAPPEGFDPAQFGDQAPGQEGGAPPEGSGPSQAAGSGGPGGFDFGGMLGGMGSGDVKLQYTDDDPDSYPNIFGSAKTDVSKVGQTRLIQALKALGEGDAEGSLDVDQVLRYLVVHNFVVNGDSYTGMMVHNYYLYEEDGKLSMLPWDYNLAFGTFQGGDASGAVNDPIDTPLSVTGGGDRPMADWVLSSEGYTALYHQYFEEFLSSVDPSVIIEEARALIAPYVKRDPTRFCTYEEFEAGADTLAAFCALRAQSVSGQLSGAIPSTSEGQAADGSALVDASALTLSDMGTMGGGGPGEGGGFPGNPFGGGEGAPAPGENSAPALGENVPAFGDNSPPAFGGNGASQPAQGGEDSQQTRPQRPEGFDPSSLGQSGGGAPQPSGGAAPGEVGSGGAPALLAASVLVLALGLAVAFKFKR